MNKRGRIKDIPSFRDLSRQAIEAGEIVELWPLLKTMGFVNTHLPVSTESVEEFRKQTEELIGLPDRFNEVFSSCGWIAFESMNTSVMKRAIEFAEAGKTRRGEEELIRHFSSPENLDFQLNRMFAVKAWHPRADLARYAMEDYLAGRFYASVPLVLALIDGLVSDVATTSFFAQNTEMTAWDSIAGHSTGLKVIHELFNKGRRKTTTEPIEKPYRNGIMHGRDLGYANEIVATKCWAALFAIGDWAIKVEEDSDKPTPEPTESERLLDFLADTESRSRDLIEERQLLSEWTPRFFPEKIPPVGPFEEETPENLALAALLAWQKENFGKIASSLSNRRNDSISRRAGRVRSQIRPRRAKKFRIVAIEDIAPSITVVVAWVTGQISCTLGDEDFLFGIRVIYESPDGRAVVRSKANGSWKIIEPSLYTTKKQAYLEDIR